MFGQNALLKFDDVLIPFMQYCKTANLLEGFEFQPIPELQKSGKKKYVTDFFDIATNYAKTFLLLDFLSCVPILTARYYYYSFEKSYLELNYPLHYQSLCDVQWFKICYYLKLIRINQFYRIFSDMSRLEITMKRKWLTKIVQIDNLFAMIRL